MESALRNLARLYSITVSARGQGWEVRLPARNNFVCELHVGSGALDWYAGVLDPADGQEVWSDWMDYRGYDERLDVELIGEKERDIASFVETWTAATNVRVVRSSKPRLWGLFHTSHTEVHWEHAGLWEPVRIWEKLPPNKRMQLPDSPS